MTTRREKHLRRLSSLRLEQLLFRGAATLGWSGRSIKSRYPPIGRGERAAILSILGDRNKRKRPTSGAEKGEAK